jgi:hypothetical protein
MIEHHNQISKTTSKAEKQTKMDHYQINERSLVPAACPIITFLRWPPIQGGTNEMFINLSNGTFSINENSSFTNTAIIVSSHSTL